ncbi:transcriptional regulator [Herbaspirillum rubrisubalbicans]|uniref:Transcriptional regulator n=1 Tax=Herbaspirillum rubrisubalbicans TaxID=80842 RepID=A0ABX9C3E6_9BURK|nr:transcriptional regulator CynR [Herbaspirillum rubrisubalbicans]RAM65044.1 transcriptional regulator [Herbaspirillum rubrisubalbicans]RAN47756.1 transcriptional regulator [Herbaspirillum rubrisubalbicans]
MQLRHIRYLLAVAEHGNFTRAAQALHVSQPTLSQQIMQLEETLGVVLLDRSGRTVKTTDAGRVYIEHARRALLELDGGRRAILDVQELERGELRLATTPTFTAYLVGPLLAAFQAKYPGITVRLKEMSLDTISAAVAADEVDLGIAFHVARPNEEIDCETLLRERLSVVVGQHHHFFKRKRSITPQMLASERLCLLSAEFATRDHVNDYLRVQKVSPAIVIEANTIGALIEVVRRSTLVTILPEAIGEQHPDLRNIAISPAPKPRTAAILRRRDAYQSAAALAFTRLCRDFPA